MADEDTITCEQAQEAVDQGDTVSGDELQEIYPDMTQNQIVGKIAQDQYEADLAHQVPYQKPRAAARQGRKTFNTGPKGVLTDHEEAKLKLRARRINNKLKAQNKMYMNLDTSQQLDNFQLIDNDEKYDFDQQKFIKKNNNSDNDSSEDDELKELNKLQKLKIIEKYLPRFGNCMEITAWNFDQEVERAPKNVFVVLHVYQDYLERCQMMNQCLGKIAVAYPHVKFVRSRADFIGLDDYPELGLPTLIVWKNGKQLQNHIAMHKMLNTQKFKVKEVEEFLIKHGVIKKVQVLPDKITKENKNKYLGKKKKNQKISFYGNNNNFNIKSSSKDDSDSELDID